MKFHEIIHPSYGVIRFSSEMNLFGDSIIFKSPNGEFIGEWDSGMGGGLGDPFGDLERDEVGYMISERLIYNEVKDHYPDFLESPEFLEWRDNLIEERRKEFESIIHILKLDSSIDQDDLDYQVKDGTRYGIGFHTILPTWDDSETTWEEWNEVVSKRFPNPDWGGLSDRTISMIEKLGYEIHINDCPGCENEGTIYRKYD